MTTERRLQQGEVIRLARNEGTGIDRGALAIVVDGQRHFPELFAELRRRVGHDLENFIWVHWLDSRKRCRDGAYAGHRFVPAPWPGCVFSA